MRADKATEYLRYDFTGSETLKLARESAQMVSLLDACERRKKEVDSAIKADIERYRSEINRLSNLVNQGYEYRNVECVVRYDEPEPRMKSIVRTDTGEVIREVRMTDDELQQELPLSDGAQEVCRAVADAINTGVLDKDGVTVKANVVGV